MQQAPKHDWSLYEARCGGEHRQWLQSFTVEESLELYEDLGRFVSDLPMEPAESERLEQRRWDEKLAQRRRMVAVFKRLDETWRE